MAAKYREGRLSHAPAHESLTFDPSAYSAYFERYQVNEALDLSLALAVKCNQLVETEKPWALAKDPEQAARLDAVLYNLAESLRIIAILISPVLPKAAAGIFAQLNWSKSVTLADLAWGGLPDGHQLGAPTPLFPRIQTEEKAA